MYEDDYNELNSKTQRMMLLAYKILNLPAGSGKDEIRKSYLRLAMQYHPDKNPQNKENEKRFVNIQNAYDFLMKERQPGKCNCDFFDEKNEDENKLKGGEYYIENEWGYYLWWRENFD